MDNTFLCECSQCANASVSQISGMNANEIITAGISVATLLLNILFYTIIAPQMGFRYQRKSDFLKYASEFISYLSTVNSLLDFDGAPTKVKSYCVSIELLFKGGTAPDPLHQSMEQVFQDVKRRKQITSKDEIEKWDNDFRVHTQSLRKELAHYTGIF